MLFRSVEHALAGSSNFTSRGLGAGAYANIELNLEVDSRRDVQDLKAWFEELWNDEALAKDVKREVVAYLEAVYRDSYVAIEPDSGDHFVAASFGEAVAAARTAYPDRISFVIHVGHQAAIHLGGLTL